MNINRHNYESFFLLYADNELSTTEKKAVETFVQQNPDLQKELALLLKSVLRPESGVLFAGKEDLMRTETPATGIHAGNYESFFLLYADNELGAAEKKSVEAFLDQHPQYQAELELLHAARMTPDLSVVYKGKQELYRREEKAGKVVAFAWWRLAAAAMLLFLLGLWWLNREKPVNPVANAERHNNVPAVTPAPAPPQTATTTTNTPGPLTAAMGDKKKNNRQPDKSNSLVKTAKHKQQEVAPLTNNLPPVHAMNEGPLVAVNGNDGNEANEKPGALPSHPRNAIDIKGVKTPGKGLLSRLASIGNPEETGNTARFVSDDGNSNNDDQIDVLNTSVNKKNLLRGILRKASRIIAKKTTTGDENTNDDDRRHILIGSFAIAVK